MYRFWLGLARGLVIRLDGVSLWFVVVSAFLELVLIIRLKHSKFQQRRYLLRMETSSNLIISTHIGIVLVIVGGFEHLAVKVWFTLVMISILKGVYGYIQEANRPL